MAGGLFTFLSGPEPASLGHTLAPHSGLLGREGGKRGWLVAAALEPACGVGAAPAAPVESLGLPPLLTHDFDHRSWNLAGLTSTLQP